MDRNYICSSGAKLCSRFKVTPGSTLGQEACAPEVLVPVGGKDIDTAVPVGGKG